VCFSPEADFVGGAVVTVIGIDVLRHRDGRRSHIALCALPLILGLHQFVEAFVWLGLQHRVDGGLGRLAMWAYLSIAFVLLPVFVPAAVLLLEADARRRWRMVPFVVVGVGVAAVLLAAMVRGPVGVRLRPYHLAYVIHLSHGGIVVGFYVLAVCGAWLVSGYRPLVVYGIVNVVAVVVIAKLTIDGFASVWCGYAALTSGALAVYMRRTHSSRRLVVPRGRSLSGEDASAEVP
jgi:hypothetical protein